MLWHLTVDFGIDSPLHFLPPPTTLPLPSCGTLSRVPGFGVAIGDRVDQSCPAMPFSAPCLPNYVHIPNFIRKVADAP